MGIPIESDAHFLCLMVSTYRCMAIAINTLATMCTLYAIQSADNPFYIKAIIVMALF